MNTRLDHKFHEAEASLVRLADDPDLLLSHRRAVLSWLSSLRGVQLMRRHALIRPQAEKCNPGDDFRDRQLPTGDREGGFDDAA